MHARSSPKKALPTNTRSMSLAAMCLALCMLLPLVTGQIPQIGNMLCPMHFPVLLAGFICGPWWALLVGLTAPLLRFALFSMPPPFPTGIAMSFELAVYGLVSGLLYRRLTHNTVGIYLSLVPAMLVGRLVWGIVRIFLSGVGGEAFTWAAFLAGAFTTAIPGILLQLLLIPLLVLILQRSGSVVGVRS